MKYFYFVSGFNFNLPFVDKLMKERGNRSEGGDYSDDGWYCSEV
jgi:hypothetical protein